MKSKSLTIGLIAAASPIPLIVFTALWSWLWFFGIGMEVLNYNTMPVWILICSLLPMLVSPVLGVYGIVYGCTKIKEKHSLICVILSVLGLIENFLLFFGIYYLGSTF